MVHMTKVCDPELVRIRTIDSSAEPKRYKQFNTGIFFEKPFCAENEPHEKSSDLDDAIW